MKLKKFGAALLAAAMLFSASAGVADAAKGGARISAPKISAPKAAAPKAAPSAQKADTPNTKDYAPSKKAADYKENAPAARAGSPSAANAAASTGTRWGSALRTMGLLAGGMMLGSMLSSMLGFGAGWMADVLGLLFNVFLGIAAVSVIMMLVRRFMGRKAQDSFRSASQSGREQSGSQPPLQDIQRGYEAKSTADKYRRL